jgi:pentatricopeptide repeat protein
MAKVSSRVSDRSIGVNLSINLLLRRAQSHVQRGQIDAAIKLYKGLLVSVPNHPQVNTELGVLSLHHCPPQEAIQPLEKAALAQPHAQQIWVCLLVAHQRCGNLVKAREVLASMRQKGFTEKELAVFEQELNEPLPDRLAAVHSLLEKHNHLSAEIAARLLVEDFPGHAEAGFLLQEVLAQAYQAA